MNTRIFFVHIMKTGGTALRFALKARFGPGEVYPDPELDADNVVAYTDVSYLRSLPEERARAIKAFSGHFPCAVVEQLPGPFITLTLVRDPVERTLSYLRQCSRLEEFRDHSLEQIYEDPWHRPLAMLNYQARVFALSPDDDPFTVMNPIEIDADRLSAAKARLAAVDVVGLQERYDEFATRVCDRLGWPRRPFPHHRVGEPGNAPPSFRRRIEDDNRADLELYEYARNLAIRDR